MPHPTTFPTGPPPQRPGWAASLFIAGVLALAALRLLLDPLAAHDSDAARHDRVAARRQGTAVICHRGASEFAHENTLEAYRAALELGADGNEIDIRVTRDGVLVCFHDDMLDVLLDAVGDVGDYDWAELETFAFRRPGTFGAFCRIPTLEEVFDLHKRHAGLMHLDIKRPGLEGKIAELLDGLDVWDHVVAVNADTAPALLKDPRARSLRYKGSLYADRQEVNPEAIAATLEKPGEMVIVDDPRGVLAALGRKIGRPSREPVTRTRRPPPPAAPERTRRELLAILLDDGDWETVPQSATDRAAKAAAIRRRALAAEEIRRRKLDSVEIVEVLSRRVRQRSRHTEWMHHGLDAAAALRALAELDRPEFTTLARECLWRDDPQGSAVLDPKYKVPASWTDFRTKAIVFDLVATCPGEPSQHLCRDYLELSDDEASRVGPPQFEAAARALLTLQPDEDAAKELLKHRRSDVRGRAILTCLAHLDEPWSQGALRAAAPHALAYAASSE